MRYTVFLKHSEGQYSAVAPFLPACSAQGQTRQEVLRNLKEVIERTLADMEVTTVGVDGPRHQDSPNVWLDTAGMFADDPLFDEMLAEVAANRQTADEQRIVG